MVNLCNVFATDVNPFDLPTDMHATTDLGSCEFIN